MDSPTARRVAIMTHVGALSGAELALMRLVTNLDTARYIPVVVTFAEGPLVERLKSAGIEVMVVPLTDSVASVRRGHLISLSLLRQGYSTMVFVGRLTKALRALDVDIVHAHSLKADIFSIVAAPLARASLVWHIHDRISEDYLPARTARLVRTLARRVPRHVVVNSRATLETLLPLPRGWTVAYPGLDFTEFPTQPGDPVGGDVIGILGRIGPTKGQDLFLRAAAEVGDAHPEVSFRVIGTPLFGEQEYEASLRVLSKELGLQHRVEFTGFVDDPVTALVGLKACVHASPVPEPFGQVIVEAMAAGVPAVVTDAGGASEIVRDGGEVLARLATPGSARDLSEGMLWILDHRDEAEEMSSRAMASVRRRFAIQRTADAVMAAWDDVLG